MFIKKFRLLVNLIVIILFLQILFMGRIAYSKEKIINPFSGRLSYIKKDNLKVFSCKPIPKPIVNIVFPNAYDKKTILSGDWPLYQNHSYINAIAVLSGYEEAISNMGNLYKLGDEGQQSLVSSCLVDWLYKWAKKNALLGVSNPTGELVRKWALASISSSYAQIIDFKNINKEKDLKIKSWINDLAYTVLYDFSIKQKRLSRNNNHLYWAAWAVGISSVILQDKILFNWSMKQMTSAVYSININGSLPLENKRKSMALHYNAYVLGPLISIANLAIVNGYKVNFYKENHGALHRLIFRVLQGLGGSHYFDVLTGFKQKRRRTITSANLAWLEIYNKIYPSLQARKLIKKLSPMKQKRLGGNLTLLYGRVIR